jgi:hypothetical protein
VRHAMQPVGNKCTVLRMSGPNTLCPVPCALCLVPCAWLSRDGEVVCLVLDFN